MAGLKNAMDLKDRFTLQYKLDIPVTDICQNLLPSRVLTRTYCGRFLYVV